MRQPAFGRPQVRGLPHNREVFLCAWYVWKLCTFIGHYECKNRLCMCCNKRFFSTHNTYENCVRLLGTTNAKIGFACAARRTFVATSVLIWQMYGVSIACVGCPCTYSCPWWRWPSNQSITKALVQSYIVPKAKMNLETFERCATTVFTTGVDHQTISKISGFIIFLFTSWEWERARAGIEPTAAAPSQPDCPGVSRSV